MGPLKPGSTLVCGTDLRAKMLEARQQETGSRLQGWVGLREGAGTWTQGLRAGQCLPQGGGDSGMWGWPLL